MIYAHGKLADVLRERQELSDRNIRIVVHCIGFAWCDEQMKKTSLNQAIFLYQATALALVALSCAPQVRKRDWSTYTGPGAEEFQKEEIDALDFVDPLEPWNRTVTGLNDVLFLGIVDPLSVGYRAVVPHPFREAVTKFGRNLLYPKRLLAHLFQGQFQEAGIETRRFLLNTTIGVLGFLDVAQSRYDIQPVDTDFGEALAHAGWKRSQFLVLPFYGPSTWRDAVGLIPDTLTDPAFYFIPTRAVITLNEATDFVGSYRQFVESTYDPYALTRIYSVPLQDHSVVESEVVPEDGPAVRTLNALFLSPNDPAFSSRLQTGRVRLASTGRPLPYSFAIQPNVASPLVLIVPGLGAHRESQNALALAEMAYGGGFSVAIISNAFNWEFMEKASTVDMPGHALADASDTHLALDAVANDLERQCPGRITSRSLLAYSMGAFHALQIAAKEQEENELIKFDRYVTLDSPVRLFPGIQKLDAYYNAPLAFPAAERDTRIRSLLSRAMRIGRTRVEYGTQLPFTEIEAQFLVGLGFRLSLQEIIYASQLRHDTGVLLSERLPSSRSALYEEIFDYSFMEYVYAFLLPYYQKHDYGVPSFDRLVEMNDLHFIEHDLRQNEKIRYFVHADDFLLEKEDIDWLKETLGEDHVRVYPVGGHIGGLRDRVIQQEILDALGSSCLMPMHEN